MYYFDSKLLKLLELKDIQYSISYIFVKIPKKVSIYTTKNKKLWKLNSKFFDIILNFKLFKTNHTFYKLFYLSDSVWKYHYKIGFTKHMIIKIIKSLIVTKHISDSFIYRDLGKKIENITL